MSKGVCTTSSVVTEVVATSSVVVEECGVSYIDTEECGVSYIDTNAILAEKSHFRGFYDSFDDLLGKHPEAQEGDYAFVRNEGTDNVLMYVWNSFSSSWTLPVSTPLSAADVKVLYESNPDTNPFTDEERQKLSDVETGAQVNSVTSVSGKVGDVTLSKGDVGLPEVDNTSDLDKPVSIAAQTALDNKVAKEEGKQLSTEDFTTEYRDKLLGVEEGAQVNSVNSVAGKTGDVTLSKDDVGLPEVDNTPDLDKPVSSATQDALDGKVDKVLGKGLSDENYTLAEKNKLAGVEEGANVNTVLSVSGKVGDVLLVKEDVGLDQVDNTSDANKPISEAVSVALAGKVDVVAGKQLSDQNYTLTEKNKLAGVAVEATKNSTDAQLRDRSTHTGVQPISSVSGLQGELDSKADTSYVNTQLATKVDKVVGKELSSNDFTDTLKGKLEELENFDDSVIQAELDTKVDKVVGKGLSDENFTLAEKVKLEGVQAGAEVNTVTSVAGKTGDVVLDKSDVNLSNVDNTSDSNKPVSNVQQTALDLKLDADANAVSASKLNTPRTISLSGDTSGSTVFDGTANVSIVVEVEDDSHNHIIANIDGLQSALDTKVDKEAGKELSSNDFTDTLRDKLAALEGSHFRGTFSSLSSLTSSIPSANPGDYADVDQEGEDAERYIWDNTDSQWVLSISKPTPLTAAQVKQLYESNPDTNPFDDAAESKLEGIQAGATANATNAQLRDRATHTGVQPISSVSGLQTGLNNKADTTYVNTQLDSKADKTISVVAGTGLSGGGTLSANRTLNVQYGTTAGTAAQGNDSRLSNSREWTASTVSQAEAEAGTATTRRAWTSQRVRQNVAAYTEPFTSGDKSKLDGIAAGAQVNVGTNLGSSGTGATRTITSSTGSNTSITYSAADLGAVPTSRTITAGDGLSGGGDLGSNRTLSVTYGTTAGTAAQGNDPRLSDSREWTTATVSQAEAEAGTASTRRAWTAQRVRQAIVSYFNSVTTSFTRTILGRSNASQVRDDLELGTAAIADAEDFETKGAVSEYVKAKEKLDNSKTLDLNFARGMYSKDDGEYYQTSSAIELLTVERATPKWVFGPNGKLREVPPNTIARQWNPATGEPEGALIEESRTNLLTWSEDFTQGAWIKHEISAAPNATLAPDGSLTATKLVESLSNSEHTIRRDESITEAGRFVASFYFKAAERGCVQFIGTGAVATGYRNFDLEAGVLGDGDIDAEIYYAGGGWYRCCVHLEYVGGGYIRNQWTFARSPSSPRVDRYQGDGTSGIYIWGAQLEQGSTPSSYIPTQDAPVTRAADNVSRELGGEFNRRRGTVYCAVHVGYPSGNDVFLGTDVRSTTSGTFGIYMLGNNAYFTVNDVTGAPNRITLPLVFGAINKLAMSYDVGVGAAAGTLIVSANGESASSEPNAFSSETITELVSKTGWGSASGSGYFSLKCSRILPVSLTEAELVELTK